MMHITEQLKRSLLMQVKKIYIDFNKENNKDGPKVKVGDPVRISKYKNIFTKGYVQNLSEELL